MSTATEQSVKFRPLADRILVKPAPPEAISQGGIVIPDNCKEKQQRGTVVAVGQGKMLDDGSMNVPEVKEGEEVLFKRYAGNEIEIEDETYIVLEEHDLLGVIG